MVVVTDHDSKVLARRTFPCKAWDLGAALEWTAGLEPGDVLPPRPERAGGDKVPD